MAKPIKYTATAPDGTIHTRNSHRTYSHIALVEWKDRWDLYSWCGRADLAQKKEREASKGGTRKTAIVAVEVVA